MQANGSETGHDCVAYCVLSTAVKRPKTGQLGRDWLPPEILYSRTGVKFWPTQQLTTNRSVLQRQNLWLV